MKISRNFEKFRKFFSVSGRFYKFFENDTNFGEKFENFILINFNRIFCSNTKPVLTVCQNKSLIFRQWLNRHHQARLRDEIRSTLLINAIFRNFSYKRTLHDNKIRIMSVQNIGYITYTLHIHYLYTTYTVQVVLDWLFVIY